MVETSSGATVEPSEIRGAQFSVGRDRDKADISPAPPRWAAGNASLNTTAAHHLPPIRPRLFSIGYSLWSVVTGALTFVLNESMHHLIRTGESITCMGYSVLIIKLYTKVY